MPLVTCTRRGCGVEFDPTATTSVSCVHHSGAPVFHEGLKGWSCCDRRVVDFDEFLKIPGCSTSDSHSTIPIDTKPAGPPTGATSTSDAPAPDAVTSSGTEVYGKSTTKPNAEPTTTASTASNTTAPKPVKVEEKDRVDSPDAKIPLDTQCKRPSCSYKHGTTDPAPECIFHNGEPVFHEGSKGWSCCKRRVLEFDEFLKIPGCCRGTHRFLDIPIDSNGTNANGTETLDNVPRMESRHDWYQTQKSVIVSVFAKKLDKENTKVTFTEDSVKVFAKSQDGKVLQWEIESLFQPIVPSESKFEQLTTKIEVTLMKANGISWASLEKSDTNEIKSWTTFGTTGGTGTVGGKEAIVSTDSPLYALNK